MDNTNKTILEEQLAAIAPSVGVKMPKPQRPSFPPEVGNVVNIPSMQTPLQEIQGYDPSMEKYSWGLYTDLKSRDEMNALNMKPAESLCECAQRDLNTLNTQCGMLTEFNCKRVGCCVYTSDNKCVAGNQSGPTAEYAGNIDYYYYKNKCYGSNCPKSSCPK